MKTTFDLDLAGYTGGKSTFCPTATEDLILNDDEVDSIICATIGIAMKNNFLQGSEFADEILKRLQKELNLKDLDRISELEPKGYVLFEKLSAFEIRVEKKEVKSTGEMLMEALK